MIPNNMMSRIAPFQSKAPVDVDAVARSFDLEIFGHDLPKGISGVLLRNNEFHTPSGFVIFVNRTEPYVRQRFTAAHEIGHFVLHRNLIGEKFEENYMLRSDKMSNKEEAEANQFAADLLMPYSLIQQAIDAGQRDIDALASALQVSKIAMGIRLGYPT